MANADTSKKRSFLATQSCHRMSLDSGDSAKVRNGLLAFTPPPPPKKKKKKKKSINSDSQASQHEL